MRRAIPCGGFHWRTSARHDELFVRVFEPEASSVMWLIPDLDAAVHVGQGDESTLEKLIIVTASLAAQMLAERQSVGMLMDVGRNRVVAQGAGRPHLWRILRALAMARAGSSNLLTTLRDAQTILSARDLLWSSPPGGSLMGEDVGRVEAWRAWRGRGCLVGSGLFRRRRGFHRPRQILGR